MDSQSQLPAQMYPILQAADLDLGLNLTDVFSLGLDLNYLLDFTELDSPQLDCQQYETPPQQDENLRNVNLDVNAYTTDFDLDPSFRSTLGFDQPIQSTSDANDSQFDFNSRSYETTYSNVNTQYAQNLSPPQTPYDDDDDELTNISMASSSTPRAKSHTKKTVPRVSTRGSVDKKESNKAAAIKYRNKKLNQKKQLFDDIALYEQKNAELRSKISDCQTEISFIKSLLVEALIAKKSSK